MNYDPHHIILGRRNKNRFSAYESQANMEMEKATNLEIWEDIKQVLIDSEKIKEILLITFPLAIQKPLRKEAVDTEKGGVNQCRTIFTSFNLSKQTC